VTAPPRVLHLIPTLDLGGAERQLRYLCPALPAEGYEPHVAHLLGGPNLPPLQAAGVATHALGTSHRDPRLVLRFARLVRRLQPAVIQTWLSAMDLVGGLVARGLRVPWVASERSLPGAYAGSRVAALRNAWLLHASAIVSNSPQADAWWAERLSPRVLHRMIPNGLPLAELDGVEPATDVALGGIGVARPLVLFVGRIDDGKNVENLLRVLARVVVEAPADAMLCGGGPRLEWLRERIHEEGLGARIHARGYVAEVPALMKRAAAFVSLSRYEGMPNAVMEAAALGCPIVLSDIAAHRAVLDDASARFVPTEDVAAASAALLETLRQPEAARRRAEAARVCAEAWSVSAGARAYAALYRELTALRR